MYLRRSVSRDHIFTAIARYHATPFHGRDLTVRYDVEPSKRPEAAASAAPAPAAASRPPREAREPREPREEREPRAPRAAAPPRQRAEATGGELKGLCYNCKSFVLPSAAVAFSSLDSYGHRAADCTSPIICSNCNKPGVRAHGPM